MISSFQTLASYKHHHFCYAGDIDGVVPGDTFKLDFEIMPMNL